MRPVSPARVFQPCLCCLMQAKTIAQRWLPFFLWKQHWRKSTGNCFLGQLLFLVIVVMWVDTGRSGIWQRKHPLSDSPVALTCTHSIINPQTCPPVPCCTKASPWRMLGGLIYWIIQVQQLRQAEKWNDSHHQTWSKTPLPQWNNVSGSRQLCKQHAEDVVTPQPLLSICICAPII